MNKASAVIVGAGPGGLGAAVELAQREVEPVLLDENPRAGGQIYKEPAGNVDPSSLALPLESYRLGKSLLDEVNALRGGIRHIPGASVIGVFENTEVAYITNGPAEALRAETLLLSLGAHDRTVPFPGWTLPGVVTVGGLQSLLKHHGILPGTRIVFAGSGLLSLLVAAQMTAAGYPPVVLIEATGFFDIFPALPGLLQKPSMLREGLRLMGILRRAGVRVLHRRAAVRALGGDRINAVEVAPVDSNWKPDFSRVERIETDCLAIGFGLVPEVSLTRLAGAEFDHRPELGGWVPRYALDMETEREGVFVAGDCCGVRGAEIAQLQGRLAGISMAVRLGAGRGPEDDIEKARLSDAIAGRERAREGLERVYQIRPGIYDIVTDETLLCRCEEISWGETKEWLDRGLNSSTQVKMATRAGMGRCQGRFCGPNFPDLLRRELGDVADLTDNLTARPPVKPVTLESLAEMAED
jgi:NADPH-dependent 2,4-dienoyl-CoA reductase/sulfur reductase-like enzyme